MKSEEKKLRELFREKSNYFMNTAFEKGEVRGMDEDRFVEVVEEYASRKVYR